VPPISLRDLSESNRPWLERAFARYIAGLIRHGAAYTRDERGIWQPDHLGYWLDPASPVMTHIIDAGDRNAGFIFTGAGRFPYKNPDSEYRLSELYIADEHRRTGIARRAVEMLWRAHPGRWELEVLPTNVSALAFWRSVLAAYESTTITENTDATVFRFRVEQSDPGTTP